MVRPFEVPCSHCGARAGVRCHNGYGGNVKATHAARKKAAEEATDERPSA